MICKSCRSDIGNYMRCPKCGTILAGNAFISQVDELVPESLAKYYKARHFAKYSVFLYYPILLISNIWYVIDLSKVQDNVDYLSLFMPSIAFGIIFLIIFLCLLPGLLKLRKRGNE